jgi:general secretion pathway protein B
MSYILDALRRADAERSRGAVPGLHAQNIPADGEPAARNFGPLIWVAGGVGALVVAVVVVLVIAPWHGAPGADARAPLAPAPELNPAVRDNLPVVAQGETPAARPGAIEPAAMPVEPPLRRAPGGQQAQPYPPAYVASQTRPAATPSTLADRAAAGRVATLASRAAAASAAVQPPVEHYGPAIAPPAPTPTAPHAAAVQNINDLPPTLRAQLPRLTVGGAIYSETPSARMVILNGQVYHEGDKPAADTVLEQIRLKTAVLNYRGQRYEVAF